ncbi:protein amalgam-like [Amphibalanus amphitrite]|uniref:protein amalgam-like n=1 Tax=Amphibalanus amphitrite TaxID=1232801 RepID=UPI001C900F12|nr:protein amalgam-like [Amphibalanus amphitrite]
MLQPVFMNNSVRHVVASVGRPAHLHCNIQHLGDKVVSWVRKRDLHILTVGMFPYTTDTRFKALHSDGTQEWTLKVLGATIADSGVYECQVSTQPKMSLSFTLQVVVARARIVGNREQHVKSGSDVNLTCQLSHDSSAIYWYHRDKVVTSNYYQPGTQRIRIETAPTYSRLHITGVVDSDSGVYTCSPVGIDPVSAVLHVINGEHPAAMQHNSARCRQCGGSPLLVLELVLLMVLVLVSHSIRR